MRNKAVNSSPAGYIFSPTVADFLVIKTILPILTMFTVYGQLNL